MRAEGRACFWDPRNGTFPFIQRKTFRSDRSQVSPRVHAPAGNLIKSVFVRQVLAMWAFDTECSWISCRPVEGKNQAVALSFVKACIYRVSLNHWNHEMCRTAKFLHFSQWNSARLVTNRTFCMWLFFVSCHFTALTLNHNCSRWAWYTGQQ